jgi:hypothetical protein
MFDSERGRQRVKSIVDFDRDPVIVAGARKARVLTSLFGAQHTRR